MGRKRAGQHMGYVDDADAFERSCHARLLLIGTAYVLEICGAGNRLMVV